MLQLYKGDPAKQETELVGEADFDLARYGKSVSILERLPMRGDVSDDSFIEIMVKTQSLEGPQTPAASKMGIEHRMSQQ